MNKRTLVSILAVVILAFVYTAEAQQPKKVPRIGYMAAGSRSSDSFRIEAFRQGLRDLGYVEGKNILIDYRFAEGKYDRFYDLAAELVSLKSDVIFTHTTPGALAAKKATTTIPIVIAAIGDLERRGIVASLARPGGNITGLTLFGVELDSKRLELLKEAVPKIARVGVLIIPTNPSFQEHVRALADAGDVLRLRLDRVEVIDPSEMESVFSVMTKNRDDAVLVTNDAILHNYRKRIAELAAKHRLPSVAELREFAEDGGLVAYGPDLSSMFRRAAVYVDKILKGTKPSDLPIERPTKFELIINLKAANQIGLTIPPNLLVRADKVIK
jgi:putative tryptophan/tyrosine transport system substrate-binding protein